MVTPEMLTFIKGELAKGTSVDSIRQSLIQKNWSEGDIDQAFALERRLSPQSPAESTDAMIPKKKKLPTIAKVGIIFVSIIIGLYVVLQLADMLILPTTTIITTCLKTASAQVNDTITTMKRISDMTQRQKLFCDESTKQINQYRKCLDNARNSNSVAMSIIDFFLHTQNKLNTDIASHNKICPDSPVQAQQ